MGTIKAVCTSNVKGIQKSEQHSIELRPDWGIEGDAHAGNWHRQVSLLSFEAIENFKELGADVGNGAFGENIIVEGFDLKALPIGTRFRSNSTVLELTQIGKNAIHTALSIIRWVTVSCLAKGVLQSDRRWRDHCGRLDRDHLRQQRACGCATFASASPPNTAHHLKYNETDPSTV